MLDTAVFNKKMCINRNDQIQLSCEPDIVHVSKVLWYLERDDSFIGTVAVVNHDEQFTYSDYGYSINSTDGSLTVDRVGEIGDYTCVKNLQGSSEKRIRYTVLVLGEWKSLCWCE